MKDARVPREFGSLFHDTAPPLLLHDMNRLSYPAENIFWQFTVPLELPQTKSDSHLTLEA